jgi:hypothetical protein
MKLIGAGFGRTGTTSLKAALEELGLGPCYHMSETFKNSEHVDTWLAAAEGRPVDWKALFSGYQATVDWPGCSFYRELMALYPDAKVLLSVRDPESWYRSCIDTIYKITHVFPISPVGRYLPGLGKNTRMIERLIWENTFHGRFRDKAHAIAIFERNIEEVRRVVPAERLLIYDVKEGWEPLCRFLGVPAPDKPFPRLNDTREFQRRIKVVQAISAAPLALAALLGLALLRRWR